MADDGADGVADGAGDPFTAGDGVADGVVEEVSGTSVPVMPGVFVSYT